ncbi:hypothetical protein OKW22_000513 [Bacilli bacterium PM5-3]|nr:hypothetical protein [Bacilli bacterium PM5-3]
MEKIELILNNGSVINFNKNKLVTIEIKGIKKHLIFSDNDFFKKSKELEELYLVLKIKSEDKCLDLNNEINVVDALTNYNNIIAIGIMHDKKYECFNTNWSDNYCKENRNQLSYYDENKEYLYILVKENVNFQDLLDYSNLKS